MVTYEGPSPLMKKLDKLMSILFVISILGMTIYLCVQGFFSEEITTVTEPAATIEREKHWEIGQRVQVKAGTIVYQSSEEGGKDGECQLDSTKTYVINGWSIIGENGNIINSDYKNPMDLFQNEKIQEPTAEGETLMLHLCLIEGENKGDKGWGHPEDIIVIE